MKMKRTIKSIISALLSASMLMSAAPVITHAAQSNEYVDPADVWITSVGRTNELDVNATTTYETGHCDVCNKDTTVLTYRVPEYTRSGETARNRGVYYSDGTCFDGVSQGNLDDGTPGVDAQFTGYHWTKCVCQNCGTINAVDGTSSYSFNKNVYSLNSCDTNFFLPFDSTSYTQYNGEEHTKIYKAGKYCQFCKGTHEKATKIIEDHEINEIVDAEIGNQRFHITGTCDDCGYIKNDYVAAKSIVESYYGKADGNAHTIELSDLSERGVHTTIRYGTSADNCRLTSAPNYTEAGYYPVYYSITYSYEAESMTEVGVSYVWLLGDNSNNASTNGVHTHDYRYLETVRATCTELGYDRFQCSECGALQKTNYTPSSGHDYTSVVVREASCQQGGLEIHSCKRCGSFYTENTSMTDHRYQTKNIAAICTKNGYTEHICIDCGYKYITDLTALARHDYREKVTAPTCTEKGFTTYTCRNCDDVYINDYTEPTGHKWDKGHTVTSSTCDSEGVIEFHCKKCDEKMIKAESATGHTPGSAATCTEPQTCETCKAILELPTGHNYSSDVTEPTCTAMGYTTYACVDCDVSYIGDYTDKKEHNYASTVTEPTCTAMGYTTFVCTDCGNEYISDYTDKIAHNYDNTVTAPTCTEMGFTTYTCTDCSDSYVADYTDVLPHNYSKQVIEPTCTSQGYTIYTCPDCGKEYIGDEQEPIEHHYTKTVTEPTCTELGFTTYVCSDCGETHKSDYVSALGHKLSEWIVDTAATVESVGSKHMECLTCGTVLKTAEIPKLIDKDNSDEDGQSKVGNFSILITDKNNKPVFDSEISIDKNDNITIKLPDGRLLSAEDITTITVTRTETQKPVKDVNIFITDLMNNAATGKTDEDGQLKVPNTQSSTGNTTGTVTDSRKTYVVIATDKNGALIPNCEVEVGDNYSINVALPNGTAFDKNNRVTVTVVTEKGEPVKDLRVQIIGDGDHIENGYTNIKGQVTMPLSNSAMTDKDGSANVGTIIGDKIFDYIVKVNDEKELIENALITLIADDEAIFVCLPEGKVIDYYNRTTVKVTKADGIPVENWKISVYNKDGSGMRTELSDEAGIAIVPPLSEAPITRPTTTPEPDIEATPLPGVSQSPKPSDKPDNPSETEKPDATEKPDDATPSPNPDESDKPLPSATPTPTPNPGETDKPNEPTGTPTPIPDLGDGAVVQNKNYKYRVYVWDNDGVIQEFGLIKLQDGGSLIIELPESKTLDAKNKTNIRVIDENIGEPVKGITVTVNDTAGISASDLTNSQGIAVVPVSDTDITDVNGNAQVMDSNNKLYNINVATEDKGNIEGAIVKVADEKITVTLPDGTVIDYTDRTTVTVTDKDSAPVVGMPINVKDNKGGDKTAVTDSNGKVVVPQLSENYTDADGKAVVDGYTVIVEDTKAKIEKAFIEITDGKISVKLPDTNELTTSNQTTVTVLDKDAQPVKDMSVIVTDKNNKTVTQNTNPIGKITVPVKTSTGGSSGGLSGGSGGGGGSVSRVTYTVTVTDKDGKTVNAAKTVKDDTITLTLPNGKTLDNSYYTIVVKDNKGKLAADMNIILKDKNNSAKGITDKNGQLILPATEHKAYIVGYPDGKFLPDGKMSRAEAAAIFARLIAEAKGEKISGKASFKDVKYDAWHYSYIAYLEKYDILKGYEDKNFRPDAPVTRAEFVAISVRYYKLFNEVKDVADTTKYSDVNSRYWAVKDISIAKSIGWLNGYADGTFRGDDSITRAEAVTVINRATNRRADSEYINKNYTKLNRFTDITDNSQWFFMDVMEAANDHMAVRCSDGENWEK